MLFCGICSGHHYTKDHNRALCKICHGNHATEEHRCVFCNKSWYTDDPLGEGAHRSKNCPDKCKFCPGHHTTEEHQCKRCGEKGKNSHNTNKCKAIIN